MNKNPRTRPSFFLLFSEEGLAISNDIAAANDTSMTHPECNMDICFKPCGNMKKLRMLTTPSTAPVKRVESASSVVRINGDAVMLNDNTWASLVDASHRFVKRADVEMEDLGLGKADIELSVDDCMDGGGKAKIDTPIAK